MVDEALKGPQITEHKNPLPCKVGDKGTYNRDKEAFDAEVVRIYSNGLVDVKFGVHESTNEDRVAVNIPVKLTVPDDPPRRWFILKSPGTKTKTEA